MRLTETDFELVDALQDDVRRPWTELARQLGRSPATVRRRWHSLQEAGAAWFSTYPGPGSGAEFAVVEVVCAPEDVTALASRLAQHPKIMTVSEVTGDIDLLCWVVAEDMTVLREVIRHGIGAAPGVRAVRDAPVTSLYSDGSQWRAGALPDSHHARRTGGSAAAAELSRSIAEPRMGRMTRRLEQDARTSSGALSEELALSPAHTRRLLTRTLQDRILTQRVDLATDGSLFTHAMALHLSVPLQELDRVAHRISRLSDTRLCAAVAGERHNLHVVMWLRSLSGAKAAEEAVLRDEDIRVRGRRIVLHYHKRLGHLFDDAGRHTGVVSWVPSGSVPRTRSRRRR